MDKKIEYQAVAGDIRVVDEKHINSSFTSGTSPLHENDHEENGSVGSSSYGTMSNGACIRSAYEKCTIGVNFKDEEEGESGTQKLVTRFLAIAVILVVMTPIAYFSYASGINSQVSNFESEEDVMNVASSASAFPLVQSIVCSNEYGQTGFKVGDILHQYHVLSSVQVLLEPYKKHQCQVTFAEEVSGDVEFSLILKQDAEKNATPEQYAQGRCKMIAGNSAEFDIQVEASGRAFLYFTKINVQSSSRALEESPEPFAMSTLSLKYMRRELKTLTVADRELFLDTMYTLWNTSTSDGIKMYGPDYRSIRYFVQIHIDGPILYECDELHEGAGFLHNHVYLELYMEQSMRAVNPASVLHYLDYAEVFSSDDFARHRANATDGGAYTAVFTKDWFGTSDPISGDVIDGRWSEAEVEITGADDFYEKEGIPETKLFDDEIYSPEMTEIFGSNHAVSPFGYQTTPWSIHSSRKLKRFNNYGGMATYDPPIPVPEIYWNWRDGVSCADMADYVTDAVDQTYETASFNAETRSHGNAHFAFAGGYADNDQTFRDEFGFTDYDILSLYWMDHFIKKSSVKGSAQFSVALTNGWVWGCDMPIYNNTVGELAQIDFEALGKDGGVLDSCYVEGSSSSSRESILNFFDISNSDALSETRDHFTTDEFTDKQCDRFIELLGSRYSVEGDLVGSAAPYDPIFWVLHGSILKMYQRLRFERILSGDAGDAVFTENTEGCSGHSAEGKLLWLNGYHFAESGLWADADPTTLTNSELASYLNPLSEEWDERFDFLFADVSYDWCPEVNAAFQEARRTKHLE